MYQTPLEIALEKELLSAGFPFQDRLLLHQNVMDEQLRMKSKKDYSLKPDFKGMSDDDKQGVEDMLMRPRWTGPLVERSSLPSPSRRFVRYEVVICDDEQEEAFKRIVKFDEYEPLIEKILRGRTFYAEICSVEQVFEEEINDMLAHPEKYDGVPMMVKVDQMNEYFKSLKLRSEQGTVLEIEFSQFQRRKTVQNDLSIDPLDGILSPIDDAKKLAVRVAKLLL